MQFLLLAMETAEDFAAREDPVRTGPYWDAWSAYLQALGSSGVMRSAAGLMPPSVATTVREVDGVRVVQDGPFADSKEHLGGYFLIEVADLDEALEWARRCPSARSASVEVRPVLPMGG